MRHVLPLLCVGFLAAQDPSPVQTVTSAMAVDNAWVKVRRLAIKAGQEIPAHDHPEHVLIALSAAAYEEVVEGGKPTRITMKAGEARHFPALRHQVKSLAAGPMEMVLIEFKPGSPAGTGLDATGAQDDPKQAKVEFSNDHLRVIRWHIAPKGTSTHGHGNHVVVFLSPGHATITPEGGAAKELTIQAGDIRWVDAQRHKVVNHAGTAAEAVTVEIRPKGK